MKKFNIILMLLLMFFVTGCGNKKFDLYQGSQDIMMNISEMAMMLLITRHIICNWKHHFTNTGRISLPVYIPIMITR